MYLEIFLQKAKLLLLLLLIIFTSASCSKENFKINTDICNKDIEMTYLGYIIKDTNEAIKISQNNNPCLIEQIEKSHNNLTAVIVLSSSNNIQRLKRTGNNRYLLIIAPGKKVIFHYKLNCKPILNLKWRANKLEVYNSSFNGVFLIKNHKVYLEK